MAHFLLILSRRQADGLAVFLRLAEISAVLEDFHRGFDFRHDVLPC